MAARLKEKDTIGLDVGNRYINMVKLARNLQGVELVDFTSAGLDSKLNKEEKLRQLTVVVQEKGLAGLPVNIGVSGESMIVRYIDLPKMRREEVGGALKYEAQQYIPFKVEDVIFDYHILEPSNSTRSRMKILLVAVKKDAIMKLVEVIQQAGLKPNLIDANAFSLINCFQFNGPKIQKDEILALVNLQFDWVNINVLQGEMPFFTRDITLSGDVPVSRQQNNNQQGGLFEIVQPLLTNLIRELRLSIEYYENEFEKQIDVIYLNGEGSQDPELVSFFGSQLGKRVSLWNPLQNLRVSSAQVDTERLKKVSGMLALACGLALRGTK
jgi:type IV pilus assembly protein PilM